MNNLSINQYIKQSFPEQSVCCLRPHIIDRAAKWFLANFPGNPLYAVKTNPDPLVLKALYDAGINSFDIASLFELELVSSLLPNSTLHYMHPVKSRFSIEKAYFDYRVRSFALDSLPELKKIQEQTGYASDLNLFVRIGVSNNFSEIKLTGKFGIQSNDAIELLRQARKNTNTMGVCFHVGSQCMNPIAFSRAINQTAGLIEKADIDVEILDVGGGFPAAYIGLEPPPLLTYMNEITRSLEANSCFRSAEVICEAGRAMVAESSSLIVKVDLRKGNKLYINDGVYGSLFEAGYSKFIYPVRLIGSDMDSDDKCIPFKFYGPSCDSADIIEGPFCLPETIREGDYIEIGQLGAYGRTMQSNFNGFASNQMIVVNDEPLMTLFTNPETQIECADVA